jgi:hypothetical protein
MDGRKTKLQSRNIVATGQIMEQQTTSKQIHQISKKKYST